jgi:tetratricopeptide (TPR) repeat protein
MILASCGSLDSQKDSVALNMKVFDQRAPASMSPPTEEKTAIVDHVHMRSKADYHFTMGEAYSLNGQVNKAIEEFRLTLVYDPESPQVRLRLSGEYLKKGFVSEAIEQAELAVQYDPQLTEAHILLGGLYSSLRMFDRALEQYQKVLVYDKNNDESKLYIGAIYVEQEKHQKAIKHFEQIAKTKNTKVGHLAHYYIGRVYLEMGKRNEAAKAFGDSLSVKPSFVDSVTALGKILESKNQSQKAIELYVSYQDRFGAHEKVAEILGRLYMEEERFDEALTQFQILERASVNSMGVKVKMALILIEQKKYRDAAVKLREVLREVPESDKIRFYLGAVYEEIKDYDKAIAEFRKIPASSTFYVEATVHGVYLYKLKNDYANATKWLEEAIGLRDDVAQFYTLYVSLLDDKKQYKKALAVLEKAAPKFPENTQVHFFLGSIYDKVGNKKATIKSMKAVLGIDEDHVQALNYLAYTYAELGQNLEEAYEMANKANSIRPNDAYITDTLGWVLYKKGKYSEAVKTLEVAYSLKPGEAIIAEHLGDAYLRQQLQTKAMWMYQRAMELSNSATERQKLNAKITQLERASMEAKAEPVVKPERSISSEK